MKPLTGHIKADGTPLTLAEYEQLGGYQALRKALRMSPQEVTTEVKNSNLKGRGGAGFNTGMKWSFVPMDAPSAEKYLPCNADETDPATSKDRSLLEGTPHQFLHGMLIAAYAMQASEGYVFLRYADKTAAKGIRVALAESERA